MDIYHYLKEDHKKAAALFEKILVNENAHEIRQLFNKLDKELTAHLHTEEATFYRDLVKHSEITSKINHANHEHDEAETLLAKLTKLDTADVSWKTKFKELKKAVEHHVHEEENVIFPEAKKILTETQAVKLAEEMDNLKKEANHLAQKQ